MAISLKETIAADIAEHLMNSGFSLYRNGRGGPNPNRDLTDEEIMWCKVLKTMYPRTRINALNFNQD